MKSSMATASWPAGSEVRVAVVPLLTRTRVTRAPPTNVSPANERPPFGETGATTVSMSAPAGSKNSSLVEPARSTSVKTTPNAFVVAGVAVPDTKKWLSVMFEPTAANSRCGENDWTSGLSKRTGVEVGLSALALTKEAGPGVSYRRPRGLFAPGALPRHPRRLPGHLRASAVHPTAVASAYCRTSTATTRPAGGGARRAAPRLKPTPRTPKRRVRAGGSHPEARGTPSQRRFARTVGPCGVSAAPLRLAGAPRSGSLRRLDAGAVVCVVVLAAIAGDCPLEFAHSLADRAPGLG